MDIGLLQENTLCIWVSLNKHLFVAGEHIDYCGYAVLPMAIEQDIVFAVQPNDSGKITLANTDPEFP